MPAAVEQLARPAHDRVAGHADDQHRVRGRRRLHVVDDVGVEVGDLLADRRMQSGFFEDGAGHGARCRFGERAPYHRRPPYDGARRARRRRSGGERAALEVARPRAAARRSCSSRTGRTARSARRAAGRRRAGRAPARGAGRRARRTPSLPPSLARIAMPLGLDPRRASRADRRRRSRRTRRRTRCGRPAARHRRCVPGGNVRSRTTGSVVGRVTAPAMPSLAPAMTRTCTPSASVYAGTAAGAMSR